MAKELIIRLKIRVSVVQFRPWPPLSFGVSLHIGTGGILFFYANYDNPVSADEMKYLFLGCSLISASPSGTFFGE